ncbi:MAG: hypothetical protein KC656_34975, partial [Myxococcales bacterium]|nr:hypothetical protein [Myxococcales bacterium]
MLVLVALSLGVAHAGGSRDLREARVLLDVSRDAEAAAVAIDRAMEDPKVAGTWDALRTRGEVYNRIAAQALDDLPRQQAAALTAGQAWLQALALASKPMEARLTAEGARQAQTVLLGAS